MENASGSFYRTVPAAAVGEDMPQAPAVMILNFDNWGFYVLPWSYAADSLNSLHPNECLSCSRNLCVS